MMAKLRRGRLVGLVGWWCVVLVGVGVGVEKANQEFWVM